MSTGGATRAGSGAGPTIAVVDTGSGNLRSVEKALQTVGGRVTITSDPAVIAAADKLVVPGQGAFGGCIAGFDRDGGALRQVVRERIAAGAPFFGICLGLQILFDGSDEDPACRGLGVLPGRVVRFARPASGPGALKVPHMGWNGCARGPAAADHPILGGVAEGTSFYFVHSYYPVPTEGGVVALTTDHGVSLCAAAARDNVFACQFHPEKSQQAGLRLLENFVAL